MCDCMYIYVWVCAHVCTYSCLCGPFFLVLSYVVLIILAHLLIYKESVRLLSWRTQLSSYVYMLLSLILLFVHIFSSVSLWLLLEVAEQTIPSPKTSVTMSTGERRLIIRRRQHSFYLTYGMYLCGLPISCLLHISYTYRGLTAPGRAISRNVLLVVTICYSY